RRRALQALAGQKGFQHFRSQWEFQRAGLPMPTLARPFHPRRTLLGLGPDWDCQNILRSQNCGNQTYFLERNYQDRDLRLISETLALYGREGEALPYFELAPLRLFDKFHRRLELEGGAAAPGFPLKKIEVTSLG